MNVVLFTGFPGFLGSELLPRVLARDPDLTAICLVQSRHAALARERAASLGTSDRTLSGRIRVVEGDIVTPHLGLDDSVATDDVVEIHHLAAIYDISVAREAAMRVNVEGTRNVIAFARRCARLRRLHYVSTCYVSGRYPGTFTEAMLEEGQRFNNFYEETKYLAEVEVRRAMRDGLAATIYRPSVVVGDSTTGATQKYDGPYSVLQLLLRQPAVALLPVIGDSRRTVFNAVPRDFVVNAIAYLSGRAESSGKTYHLADPAPLTVHELLDVFARVTGRRVVRLPLPLALSKWSIDHVPGMRSLLRIPSSAVDYFVHPTRYSTTEAEAALEAAGIRCASIGDYAGRLVAFMRAHPDVGSEAMR